MRTRTLLLAGGALLVTGLGLVLLERAPRASLPVTPAPAALVAPTPSAAAPVEAELAPDAPAERSAVPDAAPKRSTTSDFAAEYRDADADALQYYYQHARAERDAILDRIAEGRTLAHDWTRVATKPGSVTDVAALAKQDVQTRFPGRRDYPMIRYRGPSGSIEVIGFAEGEDADLDACMQRLKWLEGRIALVGGEAVMPGGTCPAPGVATRN